MEKYTKVTAEEEKEMFIRLKYATSLEEKLEIRNEIFNRFKYLMYIQIHKRGLRKTALSHKGYGGIEGDDLYNLTAEGLLKSIDSFDVTTGYRLATYSNQKIYGHVIDSMRSNSPHSRNMLKIKKEIDLYIKNYIVDNEETPTVAHLQIVFGDRMVSVYNNIPTINQSSGSSKKNSIAKSGKSSIIESKGITLEDQPDKLNKFDNLNLKRDMNSVLSNTKFTLNESIIMLLKVCYFCDVEVAYYMNFCASRVSQINCNIRSKLKDLL